MQIQQPENSQLLDIYVCMSNSKNCCTILTNSHSSLARFILVNDILYSSPTIATNICIGGGGGVGRKTLMVPSGDKTAVKL